jgi:hypothetical protein
MFMPTIKKHTVEDVAQWVIKHRKDDVFKDFTEDEIRRVLLAASDKGTLRLDFNNKGEIFGVLVFEPIIHVSQILCTQKFSMNNLLAQMVQQFPEYSCTAIRKGKLKKYNIKRTMQLLTKD